jgi:hypothetical protein
MPIGKVTGEQRRLIRALKVAKSNRAAYQLMDELTAAGLDANDVVISVGGRDPGEPVVTLDPEFDPRWMDDFDQPEATGTDTRPAEPPRWRIFDPRAYR